MKPKRVSLEGEVYNVEVETKKSTAVFRIGATMREIKGYEVQPKSEEGFFVSFSPKLLQTIFIISVIVNSDLYFGFKSHGF